MITSLSIPESSYHSYVDLITNSSSVVYVMARPSAVDQMHDMVDNILRAGGSTVRSRDLFEINRQVDPWRVSDAILQRNEDDPGDPDYSWINDLDYSQKSQITKLVLSPERREVVNRVSEELLNAGGYYDYQDIYLVVTVKDTVDDANAKLAAEMLSSLTNFFDLEGSYDG